MGDGRAASCCGCSSPVGLCHGAGCREGSAGPTAPVGRGRAMDGAGASVPLCASVGALEASSEVAVSPRSPGEPGLAGDTAGAPCTSPSPPPAGPGEVAGLSPACPARREACPGFSAAPDAVPFSGARWDESVVPTAPSTASPASPDPGAAGPAVTPTVPLRTSSRRVVSSPSASGLGMEEGALPSPWLSPGRVSPSPAAPVAVASPWLSSAVTRGPGGLPVVGSAPAAAGGRVVGRDVALSAGTKSAPSLVTDARTSLLVSANTGVAPGGAAGAAPVAPSSELGVKAGWRVKTKAAGETVWFPWDALWAVAASVTAWGSPLGACVAAPGLGPASASLPAAGALVAVTKSVSAPEGKAGLAGRPARMLWVVSVSATAVLVPAVPSGGAPRASLCAAVGEAAWAPRGPSVLSGTATAAPSPAGSTGQGVNGGDGASSTLLLGWEHRGRWDSGAGGDTKQAGGCRYTCACTKGNFPPLFCSFVAWDRALLS